MNNGYKVTPQEYRRALLAQAQGAIERVLGLARKAGTEDPWIVLADLP